MKAPTGVVGDDSPHEAAIGAKILNHLHAVQVGASTCENRPRQELQQAISTNGYDCPLLSLSGERVHF
jgi:hypothetical protein